MLNQNQMKQLAAKHAINYITDDMLVGVGSGSTVHYFITELVQVKHRIQGVVSSSEQTTLLLKQANFQLFDLNSVGTVNIYVDGADEINYQRQMLKGGGGALTREKIIASCAEQVICIADQSKCVAKLGKFPLAIEVIPMARSYVAREMVKLGGTPVWRQGFVTDNHNWIIDVYNLDILSVLELEYKINNIAGVVANGLFASCPADKLVLAKSDNNIQIL